MLAVATALLMTLSPAPAARADTVTTYRIDVSHSELTFRIRHFVSRVTGRFDRWSGTIAMDPAVPESGKVEVVIDASSINTNNERRDADLRSSNFFATDSFPEIRFVSNRVELDGDDLAIHGTLTMRGISRPVVLEGAYMGKVGSGQGERHGFEASTTIDRTEFGVTWNRAAEGGGLMLGDDVTISITVAAVRPRENR